MKNKEETTEQVSNENLYRTEIFKLLKDSLDNLSEEELKFVQELFIQESISEEELINKILK